MGMMRAIGGVLMSAAVVLPVRAEDWPQHGFYRVESGERGAERFCRLRAEVGIDGEIFAFVLTQNADDTLLVQFLSQDGRVADAAELLVGIDRKMVMRLVPERRDRSSELPSITTWVRDANEGAAIMVRLREAAAGAEWFQVVALPYNKAVPAEGLRDALDDVTDCLTGKVVR